MMTLFDSAMNINITPTYYIKQSVSLNTTKDEYIAKMRRKQVKDSSSNEENDSK